MTPAGRLAEYDVHGLRRILRAVRLGLALPPGKVHRAGEQAGGAGSDEQLTGKLAAIWAELYGRGGRRLVEQIMDDETDDDGPGPTDLPTGSTSTGQTECAYPGCLLIGKGKDGMCVKHCIALGRGDPEAREAARQFHAVRDRQPEPAHDAHWRGHPTRRKAEGGRRKSEAVDNGQLTVGNGRARPGNPQTPVAATRMPPPAQPTTETGATTMGPEKITCEKCGRQFDPRGYAGHGPTCKGPDGGKTGPRCPECGKRAKNERGLICHYAQTGHGGAIGSGQLTRDNARPGRSKVPRRPLPTVHSPLPIAPPPAGPGSVECTVCGRWFKSAHSLGCHWGKSACGRKREKSGTGNREHGTRRNGNDGGAVPGSRFRVPGSAVPTPAGPDGIAAAGHAFMRLAELLGLADQVADCPHPDGHLFLNTANGKAAIVAADGSIRAAEVIAR